LTGHDCATDIARGNVISITAFVHTLLEKFFAVLRLRAAGLIIAPGAVGCKRLIRAAARTVATA
jgi:hypothetical protein